VLRIIAALFSALCIAACGGDNGPPPEPRAETPAPTVAVDQWGCKVSETPAPQVLKLTPPTSDLDPAKTYVATVESSCGTFEITLDAKRAPKTAASFAALAKRKFYNGTTIHRIVPGFVIQGGDPTGTGTGGPGYTIRERPPKDLRYTKGVVAMAKTEQEPAGTSGSQFLSSPARAELSWPLTTRSWARSPRGRTSSTESARSRPTQTPTAPTIRSSSTRFRSTSAELQIPRSLAARLHAARTPCGATRDARGALSDERRGPRFAFLIDHGPETSVRP